MALCLMLFYAGAYVFLVKFRPYSAYGVVQGLAREDWQLVLGQVGFNPLGAWNFLAFSWHDFRVWMKDDVLGFQQRLAGALIGLASFGTLAAIFWLTAVLRFRRETER